MDTSVNNQNNLDSPWQNPPAIFRPAPFWSWNGELDRERLCKQIESMYEQGMGGFFMHSRYGLKTEYLGEKWFECVRTCVEKARQVGMKAYLYDEDRWPSGPAGGIITRQHKQYRMLYLAAVKPRSGKPGRDRLGLFKVQLDENSFLKSYGPAGDNEVDDTDCRIFAFEMHAQRPRPWENDGTYLDTMNSQAVAEFIRVTYEAYAQRYSNDFGDTIPAIFTDEPNYGLASLLWFAEDIDEKYRIHWTNDLPAEFERRRGYSILPLLPELVFTRSENEFSEARYDYHRTIAELFAENFTAQIGKWCRDHGVALTGHVLFEETMRTQIGAVGAAMPHYEHMQWPGIDILTDQTRELATAKQCVSVADQLGKERALSELYGCTGWDWPLEGHKFMADWQFATGINFLCPHLSHYSLAGSRKRDYPASIIDHSPWWKYYESVNDYLARTSLMLTQGKAIRDVLVIHPIESAWGLFNYFQDKYAFLHEDIECDGSLDAALNSIIYALTRYHYDWDFADESLLAKYGRVHGKNITIGQMSYKLVIVPMLLTLRSTTVAMLNDFLEQGGSVLFVDSKPNRIDGRINDKINETIDIARLCSKETNEFIGAIDGLIPRRISITEGDKEQTCIWSMLRQLDKGLLVFLQSHDRKKSHHLQVRIPDGSGPVVLWDPLTAKKTELQAKSSAEQIEFELELSPSGSGLITLGVSTPEVEKTQTSYTVVNSQQVSGPFEISLSEPNTLPLDYCRYRVAGEDLSEPLPVLKVDELIRRRFGLQPRTENEQQPWYLYSKGAFDVTPKESTQMLFALHVTDLPPQCSLVLENPQDYKITVNEKSAGQVEGYWLDEDFGKIDITDKLQIGENEIRLDFDYRTDTELDAIYLLGEFGTEERHQQKPLTHDNVTVVAPPARLALGSWLGQGLDFYGAAVSYKMTIERPAENQRIRIKLPEIACTAAAIHVGDKTFILPWAPFEADITETLTHNINEVFVEVIGGRKNTLGPLHTPWEPRTGPDTFSPNHPKWTSEYILNDHGLMKAVIIETLQPGQ